MAKRGEGEQDRVFFARFARLKTGMAGRKRHRFSAFWLRYKKNIRSRYRRGDCGTEVSWLFSWFVVLWSRPRGSWLFFGFLAVLVLWS